MTAPDFPNIFSETREEIYDLIRFDYKIATGKVLSLSNADIEKLTLSIEADAAAAATYLPREDLIKALISLITGEAL
jgi:hypothetical protein